MEDLIESLNEALDDVKGGRSLSFRCVGVSDVNVSDIRKKHHMNQRDFAEHFGFSLRNLQQWEQGRRRVCENSFKSDRIGA